KGGSALARLAFFLTRRKLGRVVKPVRIYALHSRLLRGYAQMELAQAAAQRVPGRIKSLASVRVALRVGCPF
ncbi:MAG TPA: hypothetical protein VGM03_15035, partial [Phycisphaerae bacterium]